MDLSFLPAVNAGLNSIATILLVVGLVLIKQRRIIAHRNVMLSAFAMSALFLITYVTHYIWRANVQGSAHTPFHGEGWLRPAYYLLLISHILLAMLVPVFAVLLIRWGLTNQIARHRRLARVAWPIWVYVSITGVVIYFMLYHFNPPPPTP